MTTVSTDPQPSTTVTDHEDIFATGKLIIISYNTIFENEAFIYIVHAIRHNIDRSLQWLYVLHSHDMQGIRTRVSGFKS